MRPAHLALLTSFLGACAPGVVTPRGSQVLDPSTESTLDDGSEAAPDDAEDGDSDASTDDTDDGTTLSDEEGPDDDSEVLLPFVGVISPADGTTAGGQLVELSGAELDLVEQVTFCGVEATIESVTPELLTVVTPEGTAGLCEIALHTADASAIAAEEFTYWEDAQGLTVAAASWTTAIFANEAHWSSRPDDEARAHLAVFDAQDMLLTDLYTPRINSCMRTDGESREDGWSDFGGVDVGDAGLLLDAEPTTLGFVSELSAYHDTFEPTATAEVGTTVGLTAAGTELSPAFALHTGVTVPDQFEVTTPDFHGPSAPIATARDFRIEWTGSAADYVGIDLWNLSNTQRIRCYVADDGSFQVPPSLLSDFGNTWTQVLVTRYRTGTETLVHNRGRVQVQAGQGLIGAVLLSN